MSIFRTVFSDQPPITGVDYDDNPLEVGVAMGWDDQVRVSLDGDDVEDRVILSYAEVRRLIDRLEAAMNSGWPVG